MDKYEIEKDVVIVDNYHNNNAVKFYTYKNDYISNQLKRNILWEPNLHQIFDKYIHKDSIVVEGGCHIGTHSLKLSLLSNKLYCFEPMKQSYSLLKRNLSLNGCSNTFVYNNALSDVIGDSKFGWIYSNNLGASGLSNNPMGIPDNSLINEEDNYLIKTITIDSLNLPNLNFMKLDVEGYEGRVINGSINTIKKYKPIITLECWIDHFGTVDKEKTVKKFTNLIEIGYEIQHIGGPDWLFLPH
jgi:FkbM family methyltransferase